MRYWKRDLIILLACLLIIIYGYWRVTTGYEGNALNALPELTLYIAIITALVTIGAVILTKKSLELISATTRPFLNVNVGFSYRSISQVVGLLNLIVKNSGNLPAYHVLVDCTSYLENDKKFEQLSLKQEKTCQSIILPTEEAILTYSIEDKSDVSKFTSRYNYVTITVKYQSQKNQEHITQRKFQMAYISAPSGGMINNLVPIPEEDSCD